MPRVARGLVGGWLLLPRPAAASAAASASAAAAAVIVVVVVVVVAAAVVVAVVVAGSISLTALCTAHRTRLQTLATTSAPAVDAAVSRVLITVKSVPAYHPCRRRRLLSRTGDDDRGWPPPQ